MKTSDNIRSPAVAGMFYPKGKKELKKILDRFLGKARIRNLPKIKGIIVPHAGYIYSGPIAAEGYKQIDPNIKTVIILAPSHQVPFDGVSIADSKYYSTPLGKIKLNNKVERLLKEDTIVSVSETHKREHSLEVQLPFLQRVLENFQIIPLVTGKVNPRELADILIDYIDDDTLIVVSSDLSHYHTYEDAVELDKTCIENILDLNFDKSKECEACGLIPILTLMYIADKLGWESKLIDYRNSGDTAGSKNKVVGYTSIGFYKPPLKRDDQNFLLKLARDTIESYLMDRTKPEIDEDQLSMELKENRACFVTLTKNGQLRGCIGNILPEGKLYKNVMENTINAAIKDNRFQSVDYDELDDIEIEISVLTLPEKLVFNSPDDLLKKLTPMRDGVVLKIGNRTATYLPQVWKKLPDREHFLSRLCMKCGSSPEQWRSGNIQIEVYHDFAFHD